MLRYEWLRAFVDSGCASPSTGWEDSHLTLWRGGRLAAVAVAWRKHHSMGEYIYDFAWANASEEAGIRYYPKLLVGLPLSPVTSPRILVGPGEDLQACRRFFLDAATHVARETQCASVHVLFSPAEEADALALQGYFRRASMQYQWFNRSYRDYDDYLSRFDSKRRNQLRRERAAAAKAGIAIRTLASEGLHASHGKLAWQLYQSTAARHAYGPMQLNRPFFMQIFQTMRDALELVVAERNGEVIAGAFNLRSSTRLFGRYWGAFVDVPLLHFNVCFYHGIDACIRSGLSVFEPGAGGEHKIARGFEPTVIHSLHRVFEPRLSRAIESACQREAAAIYALCARSAELAGFKHPSAS